MPNYSSICILRLSAIGDVCHGVSAVQAIQKHYPKAKITWVVGKVEAMLLADLPGVELIVFDKKQGKTAYKQLKQQFKGQCFDVLLNMQVALRAGLVSRCIPAKVKIGFDWARSKELHSLFINKRIAREQQAHVLEGFKGFAQAIGVDDYQPSWQMPYSLQDETKAEQLLGDEYVNSKLFAIAPAASKAQRNWLPERYAKLADYAHKKGFKVVLTGGPTELETNLAKAIINNATVPILNLVGKTKLKELLCVLKKSSLLLAPDTGPAHMAVTVNTPVIGLYAHSNPARTGPYLYQNYVVEVYHQNLLKQTGKTAEQLPWGTRVKGDDLMAQITTQSVMTMFDNVVEKELLE
ncbi:glycosyltransferase family 9 protein [Pseudoalteromonas sp. MMG010]|uniref:glycosyltransferase family 9 protein n=1 Tax=Pseudoalteromonas sp. MMG010 TaxID=2822685 RepID=UPI001B3A216D|nr:glycosyltransferase family 9 protein [Pseudoalteromonas sp. MMG010]